jgi:anti-sigma regulatory factor (Ser/Thr protein kinase)
VAALQANRFPDELLSYMAIPRPEWTAGPVPVRDSQHGGMAMADDWPLHTYMELGALPGAVTCARLHARQILWEWGYSAAGDTVELLVSELVTNAMYASRAMNQDIPLRFWLLSDKTRVVISVWDGNPHPPVRRPISADAESGRGLLLVETLSDQWDWYAHQTFGGKVVWCAMTLSSQPDSRRNAVETADSREPPC